MRPLERDRGSILTLAVITVVVLGMVVAAMATYLTAGFTSSRVSRDRNDRLAAAEAGLTVAIDRLQLRQTLCTTGAAQTEFEIVVPAPINGAEVRVTCRRSGVLLTDVQGWAAVVTGEGVSSGPTFTTQGGGNKSIGGAVYVHDVNRISVSGGNVEIFDGDLWFNGSGSECRSVRTTVAGLPISFSPAAVRGPICTRATWREVFNTLPPALPPRPPAVNPPHSDHIPGCRTFYPGTYTVQPALANQNYFAPGDYYFQNIGTWTINRKILAGLPAGPVLDDETPFSTATNCLAALAAQQASGSTEVGATFVLGGNTRLDIPSNGGELEILRRPQGANSALVSIIAVTPDNVGTQPGYQVSTVPVSTDLVTSSSGNNSNLIIHGIFWAPYSRATLDNVTNRANGQLLGGVVVARLHLQSSGSASGFVVEVDPSPQRGDVLLEATARDSRNRTTTVRAVVQLNPDSGDMAIRSWRVLPPGET